MFHKKIDNLQNDVDEMLELLDEEDTEYQDLGVKILKAQDGELAKRGYKEMERQLTRDEKALYYYIDFQSLTILLREHFDEHWLSRMLDSIKNRVFAGSA